MSGETRMVADGERMYTRWVKAYESVKTAERELRLAETELSNAESELGRWMVPKDAKANEVFNVWWGSKLICVVCPSPGHH